MTFWALGPSVKERDLYPVLDVWENIIKKMEWKVVIWFNYLITSGNGISVKVGDQGGILRHQTWEEAEK